MDDSILHLEFDKTLDLLMIFGEEISANGTLGIKNLPYKIISTDKIMAVFLKYVLFSTTQSRITLKVRALISCGFNIWVGVFGTKIIYPFFLIIHLRLII